MSHGHVSTIIVVGSANQDYIIGVAEPPGPGETVLATSLLTQPGGKGANQAVAAARLGGTVRFVGAVGDDADGAAVIRALRSEGVDTSDVEIVGHGRTGLALVSVSESGENSITVVPGANFSLTVDRVARSIARIAAESDAAIVVVQAEIRPEIISAAVAASADAGARVIVNLAPYTAVGDELLGWCDPLVVNEAEATGLLGWEVRGADAARRAVRELRQRTRSVVVTLGAAGAYWIDDAGEGHVPAPRVAAVDTTGAGDAFVGALAAQLASGAPLAAAAAVGVRTGAFAVQSPGAQSSYPAPADIGLDPAECST